MIQGLEHISYKERPSEKAQGDLINVSKYLMGRTEDGRARLFSGVCSDRARDSRHKVKNKQEILSESKKTTFGY